MRALYEFTDRIGRSKEMSDLIVSVSPYTSKSIEDEDMHRIRVLGPLYGELRKLDEKFKGRPIPYERLERDMYTVIKRCRKTLEKNCTVPIKVIGPDEWPTRRLGISPLASIAYAELYRGAFYPMLTGDFVELTPQDTWGDQVKQNTLEMEVRLCKEPRVMADEASGVRYYMNLDTLKALFKHHDPGDFTEGQDFVIDYFGNRVKSGDIGYFSLRLKRSMPPTGFYTPTPEIVIATETEAHPPITREEIERYLCTVENSKGETYYMNLAQLHNFSKRPGENTLFEWDRPDIELDEFPSGLPHQKKKDKKN